MSVAQRIGEEEYQQMVMAESVEKWELHDGRLVQKPGMSGDRGRIVSRLAQQLRVQLDATAYEVCISEVRLRKPVDTIVIPDMLVVPATYRDPDRGWSILPMLTKPLPLVVEVWSPPADGYDVDAKIPIYQQRGDFEVWRIHPHDRTLTSWVRQADGTYAETVYKSGMALPAMLAKIPIDRGERFDA